MSAWPAALWTSPWLRGLDVSARATLEATGELRRLARGNPVFAAGETADAFFVVAEGLVDVTGVRRGETEARVIRRAAAGDAVGEEAFVRPGTTRVCGAAAATDAVLVRVPANVYRREAARSPDASSAAAEESVRTFRRAAARDALGASSLGRALGERQLASLARAARHVELERDEVLFSQGDAVTDGFVVAEGMLAIETEDDGRARIGGYLARGDVVAVAAGSPNHRVTARACGAVWVLALPRDELTAVARSGVQIASLERIAASASAPEATRHVLGDLWRFAVAGSMLVIDDETCVRCGACVWACADTHDDGVSRLVRRGEKVRVRDATDGSLRALIVPGGCQHCKHPACMVDCPTGAIGRDPRGHVFIREELCIGCGQCERACPWGSIAMAPRVPSAHRRLPLVASAAVAVKCDLCADRPEGPACVAACPVDAIARVEPLAAMVDVRRVAGRQTDRASLPRGRSTWPWMLGAAIVAASVARVSFSSRSGALGSGLLAGALLALAGAYPAFKRARWRTRIPVSASFQATAHGMIGVLCAGVVASHASGRLHANAAGAALVALAVAGASGVVAAIVYMWAPRVLSRIERRAMLAEELADRVRDLQERTFAALTGRSDATKAAFARWLVPYARSSLGSLALIASRRTLSAEETRLRQRIEAALGGPVPDTEGLRELVRISVEQRATRAQRVVQAALRACVPVHVVTAAVAVGLVVVHVASVVVAR